METCRLNRSHVRLGVSLPGNIFDDAGHLLLSKGYVPDNQEQIDQLLARGLYVEISVYESCFKAMSADEMAALENKFDPFLIRNSLKISLNRLLRTVLDHSVTSGQILDFAGQLQSFAMTDPIAAMAACLLDHHEEIRPVAHALNTGAFGTAGDAAGTGTAIAGAGASGGFCRNA